MKFSVQIKFYVTLLFLILFLPSCGLWSNFTTYFNLYYNASELFDKAEKQIKAQQKDIFATELTNVSGTTKSDLVKVIEKCSDLLQFNSESAYVDNTLMLLGKSFYYQKNYQKARRKFNELIENYPESSLLLEAKLWLGKCQMRLRQYDDALAILSGVKKEAVDEGEDDIIREAYIEEIVYRISIEDIEGAIAIANEFMDVSDDDEVKATVWFEIGRLNMQIGDVKNAIISFNNVFEFSPDFDLEYDAKLNYGIALREGGRSDEALTVFEDMRDEDKYTDSFDEIDFQIAKTYDALGKIPEAIDLYAEVDTLYKSSPVSGASKYELGEIYSNELGNLDTAAVYYSKAATSTLPKDYLSKAKEKNRLFQRYVKLKKANLKNTKELYYAENPDEFVKDSVAYVEDSLAIAKEIANIKELQAIWSGLDSLLSSADTTGFYADTIRAIDSLIAYDSTSTLIKDSLLTHLRKPLPSDSNYVTRFDSIFNNPVFAQRRNNLNNNAFNEQKLKQQNQQLANQLPDTLKFKNNPPHRPKIPPDSLRTLLAKNQLELGNLYLSELNMPDSAKKYYEDILTNMPNTQYQANTLYALGSYYLTVDNKSRADSLFDIVYENYKNESIVNAAAQQLHKPFIDLNYDPAKDDYEDAEYIMQTENYKDAVEQFWEIYKNHPRSQFAARALYASGWILEHNLNNPDSAAAIYDTLVAHYPTSVYVRKVAGKLSYYKQEQRRLESARKDSLKALNVALSDSLGGDSVNQVVNQTLVNPPEDTTKVVLKDEKPVTEKKKVEQQNVLPKVKEPLWNPRKRKY